MTAKEFLHNEGVTNDPRKGLFVIRGAESFDLADIMERFVQQTNGKPCKIEIKDKEHLLGNLWLWDYAYSVHEDVFDVDIQADITKRTGLEMGSLGDWWINKGIGRPDKSWKELVDMSIEILTTQATRLVVDNLYLDHTPKYSCKDLSTKELPINGVSGSKRVNASCVEYHGRGDFDILPKFNLYGKDDGCCVEGSWLDWCMFACNVLASYNTELACPELYAPGLANNNY